MSYAADDADAIARRLAEIKAEKAGEVAPVDGASKPRSLVLVEKGSALYDAFGQDDIDFLLEALGDV
jgi:hypothetical protein